MFMTKDGKNKGHRLESGWTYLSKYNDVDRLFADGLAVEENLDENLDEDERKRATFTIEDWSERKATAKCQNIEDEEEKRKPTAKPVFTQVGK